MPAPVSVRASFGFVAGDCEWQGYGERGRRLFPVAPLDGLPPGAGGILLHDLRSEPEQQYEK